MYQMTNLIMANKWFKVFKNEPSEINQVRQPLKN